MNKIKIKLHGGKTPTKATGGAAGFDLYAVKSGWCVAGAVSKIPLGFSVEVPEGYMMVITGRSGLAAKHGAGVPQGGGGIVDSDYRGEVCMLIVTEQSFQYEKGERIGQALIVEVPKFEFEEVDSLSDTDRGVGGFGSTGV